MLFINPLPPNDAVRKQKKKLEDLFSLVVPQFENYYPSGNLKFDHWGIFQNLKFRILIETMSFQFPLR